MQSRITPKKSFSQNFLNDSHVAKKIAESLKVTNDSIVIEIGPGTGALTKHLLSIPKAVYALELDERAVVALQTNFPQQEYPNLHVVKGDALQFDIQQMYNTTNSKLFAIGNIPYAITADLMFWLYANSQYLKECVVMVQKEVAKRIVAKPRTKEYGILTIATELCGKAKILFDVQPGSFYPVPKVTSSVFRVEFFETQKSYDEVKNIMALVKAGFNQRRKKLSNALQVFVLNRYNIDIRSIQHPKLDARAEELTTQDFIDLFVYFESLSADEATG